MKKVLIIFLTLISYLIIPEDFTFTYFDNYPPLSWKDNIEVKGILVDIMEEIVSNRMGFTIKHGAYPWKRAQLMVKSNKADGFITIPTKERLEYTNINKTPVYIVKFTIFVNNDNQKIKSISGITDLKSLSSYNLVHYLGSGWAKSVLGDYNVYWTRTLDEALLLLYLNRVDIFIDPSDIVNYNLNKKEYTHKIKEIKRVLDKKNFMLCVGLNSSFNSHLDDFDFHLNEMKKDGTMDKILSNYR